MMPGMMPGMPPPGMMGMPGPNMGMPPPPGPPGHMDALALGGGGSHGLPPIPGQTPLPSPGAAPDPYGQNAMMDRELQERAADVRAAYERLQYERALLERERLAARL